MPITEAQYKDMKEYWDYQRVLEFNREKLKYFLFKAEGRIFNHFGPVSVQEMYEQMWPQVEDTDLEKPDKGWIPQDKEWRFEWEPDPNAPKRLTQSKGRPVVLRAKIPNE